MRIIGAKIFKIMCKELKWWEINFHTAHDLLGVVFPHYIFLQMNTWLCRHFRCAGGLQSAGLRFAATATLHSYYRKWLWSVTERDGLTSECSYGRLRSAWLSFVSLHPVDSSVFQCSLCGVSPEIFICDGITLSFQKRFRIGTKAKADEGDPLNEGLQVSRRFSVHNMIYWFYLIIAYSTSKSHLWENIDWMRL